MVQTLMKKDKVVCKLYLAEARDGIQKFSKLFFFFQRYAAFFYDLTDELVRERNTEYSRGSGYTLSLRFSDVRN